MSSLKDKRLNEILFPCKVSYEAKLPEKMQASLRGHRIKYILMAFTGLILSTTSFDKIEALENTERFSAEISQLSIH